MWWPPPTARTSSTTSRGLHRGSLSARPSTGWLRFDEARGAGHVVPARRRDDGADTLLLYFTSGTTAQAQAGRAHPRLAIRSATSRRCTGSGSGRATSTSTSRRRAGPSTRGACVFAPWNAEATVLHLQLRPLRRRTRCSTRWPGASVTTFCAPPTVWRMLIQHDLAALADPAARGRRRRRAAQPGGHRAGPKQRLGPDHPRRLRPDRDHRAARQPTRPAVKLGSMGRPLPGTRRAARPRTGEPGDEGEIAVDLDARARSGSWPATATRRRAPRRRCAAATTTPATSRPATPTATSPTSGAPTTCSRHRTT